MSSLPKNASASDASSGGETTRPCRSIERFAAKCRFDPVTGCVNWIGGTGSSRGGREKVGRFWDEGKMWNAHQWAAKNIHGIDIEANTVYRSCRNPLCVQHVEAAEGKQGKDARFMWLGIGKGFLEPEPEEERPEGIEAVPIYTEPEWLRPFLKREETNDDPF